MQVWSLTAALVVASAGAVYDVFTHRIPNVLSYGGMIIGIAFWILMSGWRGFLTSILGALIAGGIFLVLYVIRAMGAGDVKLMAAVGSIVGPRHSVEIVFACAIAGGIMAIAYAMYHHQLRGALANVGELLRYHVRYGPRSHPNINLSNPAAIRMPYGVAIAAGCLYAVCLTLLKR
jgi:prepilin peptidase CpaA